MISIFTCTTLDCENHLNPVYLGDAVNPVSCGACYALGDATVVEQPIASDVIVEEAAAK